MSRSFSINQNANSRRGVLLRRPSDEMIDIALREAAVAEATRAGYFAALSKLRRIDFAHDCKVV